MNEDSDNCLDKCTRPHNLHWDDQEMGTAISFMQRKAVSPVGYIAFIQIYAFQFHLPRVTKPSFVYIVYADIYNTMYHHHHHHLIPARVRVLYTGHKYIPVSGCFRLAVGISHMTGISVYSSLGFDSESSNLSISQRAPSRKSPQM